MNRSTRKKLKKQMLGREIWDSEEERQAYMEKEYEELLDKKDRTRKDNMSIEIIGREIGAMI